MVRCCGWRLGLTRRWTARGLYYEPLRRHTHTRKCVAKACAWPPEEAIISRRSTKTTIHEKTANSPGKARARGLGVFS